MGSCVVCGWHGRLTWLAWLVGMVGLVGRHGCPGWLTWLAWFAWLVGLVAWRAVSVVRGCPCRRLWVAVLCVVGMVG